MGSTSRQAMSDGPTAYRARWVVPVDSAPIENGTVVVQDGLIVAVHDRHDRRAVDLGNTALLPGLVNAHTHLEFSHLAKPLQPFGPFTAWLSSVIAERESRNVPVAESIAAGLRECVAHGTTLVGEIATSDDWPADSVASQPRVVRFRELIGLTPDRCREQLDQAERFIRQPVDDRLMCGLSPHAPYSVARELLQNAVALAEVHRIPLAMHLAESRSERELLAHGCGEFAEWLQRMGLWRHDLFPSGQRPLDYLRMFDDVERVLVIHGNFLDAEEIACLAERPNMTVVYCPRTHHAFGHPSHPWRKLLAAGVRVALGTDSRASNPDLSLWEEMRFLHERFADIRGEVLLKMATLAGAEALGCEATSGSIAPGKWADLAVVQLPERTGGDLFELLFSPESRPVGTMVCGQWLYGGPQ